MSARASGANAAPNGDAKDRSHVHHDGSSGRAFTVEQKQAVIRVRKCSPTGFYDILGLEEVKKTCTDGEIKKAYRKLSLLTHPDKNGYTGADEAFKMVSRAFQILSDEDKKSKYDRFGGDPDSRSAGASSSASPFSGFARTPSAGMGGRAFADEISPEELFRQFFGGGMGGGFGGPFGGSSFVFDMGGGPGVRVHQFGGNRPRRRPNDANQQPPAPATILHSLFPLLLLFLAATLSSWPFGGSTSAGPQMRFDEAVPPQTQYREFGRAKVPYWVDPVAVQGYTSRQWKDLDKAAEVKYVGQLNVQCENEYDRRNRLVNEAQGFFFTDQAKMDQARRMEMVSCRRLNQLGYRHY